MLNNYYMIRKIKGNIIFVDFALTSMIKAVEEWYKNYYQHDHRNIMMKAHIFHLIRFYEQERFNNYNTIGEEREKYLEEIDLYVQMRRDD